MKKLGLVGGISWVSTIDYYRHINEGINERLGGLEFAECLVHSLNFDARTYADNSRRTPERTFTSSAAAWRARPAFANN